MLFGRGGRNFWVARIALLFIVLTAGAVFHYHGAAYWTVRGLYYALIVGFIATAVLRNRGRQRGVGTSGPGTFSGPPFGRGGVQPPFGGSYPPSQPHGDLPPSVPPGEYPQSLPAPDAPASVQQVGAPPFPAPAATAPPVPEVVPVGHSILSAPGQQPGWYPDPSNPMARQYWDGTAWSHRLKWDGQTWVPV
jgi:general stress protein CsbA